MKKIITFSLWGSDDIYWIGAKRNIELVKEYLPGWICRFYIDSNCDDNLINSLKSEISEIILMNPEVYNHRNISERFNHSGLFWRFQALKEKDTIVLSRDCDSRISNREVMAINQWLESDKDFHIMRDHPYHQVPILSGMWGARNNILINIDELLYTWTRHTNKGVYHADDQDFLGQIIYPIVINKAMEHSEFNISYGNSIYKFPTIRVDNEFIGDVFDINEDRHPDYWKIIEMYSR